MATTKLVCNGCNSEFSVKSSMDPKHYKPHFCVYCGDELEEERELEIDYPELDSQDE